MKKKKVLMLLRIDSSCVGYFAKQWTLPLIMKARDFTTKNKGNFNTGNCGLIKKERDLKYVLEFI